MKVRQNWLKPQRAMNQSTGSTTRYVASILFRQFSQERFFCVTDLSRDSGKGGLHALKYKIWNWASK